jgi:hypothetical protein
MAARIAALLLCLHSLIELLGPLALTFNPQGQSGFEMGGVEGQQFEANVLIIF